MSLSLQPAVTSSPLNGLPAQPVDGAASQLLSFEEVLKVEEKKMQQEINAQSAAALLATIQQPAISESIHGFDAGNPAQSTKSVDQAALTVDTVQPAAAQPKQNTLPPQQVIFPEKAGFSAPTTKAVQTIEANLKPSLQLQTQPQPKENETAAKRPMAIDESQEQPATTFAANTKTAPASTPVTDAENLKEKTGVKISIRKDESITKSTSKPVSFKASTTHSSEAIYIVENIEMPNLSQPSGFTVSESSETIPVENKPQKIITVDKKPVETIQTKAPDFSVPQPVEKAESPAAKISVENLPIATDGDAKTNKTISAVETKPLPEMDTAAQVTMKINVTSLPVSKANTSDEKIISLETAEQKQAMLVQADIESDSGTALKNDTLNNGASALKKDVSQQRAFIADSRSTLSEDVNISVEKPATPERVITSKNETSQPVDGAVTPKLRSATTEIDTTREKEAVAVQVNIPSKADSQPAKELVALSANFVAPEINNESDATRMKIAVPVQSEVPTSEAIQPVKETVTPSAKFVLAEIDEAKVKRTTPIQSETVAGEMSQPVDGIVAPSANFVLSKTGDEIGEAQVKMTTPIQTETATSETSQPVKEIVTPSAKFVMPEIDEAKVKMTRPIQAETVVSETSQPVKETIAPSAKFAMPKIDEAKVKMTTPVQAETVISETSQPVKEIVTPSAKLVLPEIGEAQVKMTTPIQAETVAGETSQPVKETVAPSAKFVLSEIDEAKVKMTRPIHAETVASEVTQPAKETIAPSAKSTMPEIDEAKVKRTTPIQAETVASKTSQPVKETVAPSAKFTMPEMDEVQVKMTSPIQAETVTSKTSQPVKETITPNAKFVLPEMGEAKVKLTTPIQAETAASETSQPVKETIAPSAKYVLPEIDEAKVKVTRPIQAEIVTSETSQPVKETIAPSAKFALPEIDEAKVKTTRPVQAETVVSETPQPVKEIITPSAKFVLPEMGEAKVKLITPIQAETAASETSQPVKETIVPSAKFVLPESDEAQAKVTTPVQAETVTNKTSQPVKGIIAPSAKFAMPEIGEAKVKMITPIQAETVTSETSQPVKETMLKIADDNVSPALEFDNAAAESLLKVGSRLQIKNEAIAFEQGNIPAEIKPERVPQSVRVEIESDEKVTAKEPALDLESKVVIAGADKGLASIDVVRNSSAVQVDPMARDVVEQITSQIKTRIKNGETSIRVKLNPEKLGEIEVQMTHSAQGVSVSFITEQASTGQLIESQVNQLRQSLKDAGVQLANLNINQHGQSNQEGGGFRQSQQFVQTSRRDVSQVEDAGTQPQHVGMTSEIDYLV